METTNTISEIVKKSVKKVMIVGILIAVIGLIAIIYPEGFGKVSVTMIGAFMVIVGFLRLTFAITSYSWGSLFIRYIYGILMIIGGVWVIGNPDMGLEALTVVMAVYFIIDGLTQFFYSFSLIPIGGGVYLLLSGILSLGLGVFIFMEFPESSTYAIGIYLGIKLLLDGISLALTGKAVYKTTQVSSN